MTRDEVKEMMTILHRDRPRFMEGMNADEKSKTIDLWYMAFGQYDSRLMEFAMVNLLKHNPYEPNIAGLQSEIDILIDSVNPDSLEFCINEAWKAVQGTRKFDELPPAVQKYFGSQHSVDEFGRTENFPEAVFRGQIMKVLPGIMDRMKTESQITPEIEEIIHGMLDDGQRSRLKPRPIPAPALPEAEEEKGTVTPEMRANLISIIGYDPLGQKGE